MGALRLADAVLRKDARAGDVVNGPRINQELDESPVFICIQSIEGPFPHVLHASYCVGRSKCERSDEFPCLALYAIEIGNAHCVLGDVVVVDVVGVTAEVVKLGALFLRG